MSMSCSGRRVHGVIVVAAHQCAVAGLKLLSLRDLCGLVEVAQVRLLEVGGGEEDENIVVSDGSARDLYSTSQGAHGPR
jgi:microcompartment protein CcmK/EutM